MIFKSTKTLIHNTTMIKHLPKRGFYFHLDQSQRNVDFPLNIGYNDNFKYHSQIMTVSVFQSIVLFLEDKPKIISKLSSFKLSVFSK